PRKQRSFRRAFMPLSASSSAWATVEDGGEDGSVEQDIHRTNPLFSLPREARERTASLQGGGRPLSGIDGRDRGTS
ncbi:unnamed protein product, partial [Scytosiphon promiscuus]